MVLFLWISFQLLVIGVASTSIFLPHVFAKTHNLVQNLGKKFTKSFETINFVQIYIAVDMNAYSKLRRQLSLSINQKSTFRFVPSSIGIIRQGAPKTEQTTTKDWRQAAVLL